MTNDWDRGQSLVSVSSKKSRHPATHPKLKLKTVPGAWLLPLLLLLPAIGAAQDPPLQEPAPPTWESGYRAGEAAAREKPVTDWLLIGGGASLLTSGCAVPFTGAAAFVVERPRIRVPDVDDACGAAYALGYEEGFEITVKRRRAAAAWFSGASVAMVMAMGLGIVNYHRAQQQDPEDASLVVSPALFRF